MKTYNDIGIQIPQLYLPKPGTDLTKWAVIACDQFTSQPEYWQKVEELVGGAPSTLNLILPEVFLEKPGEAERIQQIQSNMQAYLEKGMLQPREGPDLRRAQRGRQDAQRHHALPGPGTL